MRWFDANPAASRVGQLVFTAKDGKKPVSHFERVSRRIRGIDDLIVALHGAVPRTTGFFVRGGGAYYLTIFSYLNELCSLIP